MLGSLGHPTLLLDRWTGTVLGDARELIPRNPYPGHFRNMHEIVSKQPPGTVAVHALRFAGGSEGHPRLYNSPSAVEMACVVVGEGPLPQHYVSIFERPDEGFQGTRMYCPPCLST